MSTLDKIDLNMDVGIPTKDLVQLAADVFHEHLIDAQIFRSCLNCDNYNKEADICNHYNAKPPAHVIVYSCKTSAYIQAPPF